MKHRPVKAAVGLALIAGTALTASFLSTSFAQGLAAGPFTAAQAAAGKVVYEANCAACHQRNLSGAGEAPPVAGTGFIGSWGARTTKDLFEVLHATMPLGAGGSLTNDEYVNIVAYLLASNGAKPGQQTLTATTAVKIDTVATGVVTQLAEAPAAAPAAAAARRAPAQRWGMTAAGEVKAYTPVTDAMLLAPPAQDWLMHLHDYQGWSYSPLSQITPKNADLLQLKWAWAMEEGGRQQINPLVHDGVMFLSNNFNNVVEALDAKTGELIWQNRIGPTSDGANNATRTMALWENLLIYPGTDATLYGLDARNGKIVWKTKIVTNGDRIGGLMVVNGKVLLGLTRCDSRPRDVHCFIGGYDAKTGKELWRFKTVALTGQPGGDTWNGIPDDQRAGSDAWISGTYDPKLNLTYWGTGQAKPWLRAERGTGAGATDYANSTVALNPDTGKLSWWYNHAPGESLDLDAVFERTLIDHDGRQEVVTVDKTGIMWKLDRATGKYIQHKETTFQNVFDKLDPKTGVPTYRQDVLDQTTKSLMASCPGPQGGKNWQSQAYDPAADLLVIPLAQSCVMFGASTQLVYEMPGTDGNMGLLAAYDAKTFKPVWSWQQRSPFLTGVISTAGGVSFVGDYDRSFKAVETRTGKTLWEARLGTTVQGYPVTFSVDGVQYVAVTTGISAGSPQQKPNTLLGGEGGEVKRPPNGHAVYVFALPASVR